LQQLLNEFEQVEKRVAAITDLEHEGNSITHDILERLNRSFVTPLERHDIHALASALDNVVDRIEEAANHLLLYRVDEPTDDARELARILVAVQAAVRKHIAQLDRRFGRITQCRVVVEIPHRRHHQGNLFHVRVDLTVPRGELVVRRDPGDDHRHEDVYVAIHDAFRAVRRELMNHVLRLRADVKSHNGPPTGRVAQLNSDHGFLVTADGRASRRSTSSRASPGIPSAGRDSSRHITCGSTG
jgi:ribosome-associated translation inhibitor RaiA